MSNQDSTNSNIMFVAKYVKPHKLTLIGVILSLIITSSSVLIISKFIKVFIDYSIIGHDKSTLNLSLILLFTTIVLLALFTACRYMLITWVGEKIVSNIKFDIFNHMLKLAPNSLDQYKSGELLSKLTSDTAVLLALISGSLSSALRNFIMLLGGLIMLISTSPKLSILLLVIIPVIILPIFYVGRKLKVHNRNSEDKVILTTSYADQALNGLKTVQAYRGEKYEAERFYKALQTQLQTTLKKIKLRGLLTALIIILIFFGISIILWIGIQQIILARMTPGQLTAYVYISVICAASIGALTEVLSDFQKANASVKRIFQFLKQPIDDNYTKSSTQILKEFNCDITFQNVCFKYDNSRKRLILNNISFTIPAKQVTALVGRSGSGKTTIFMLLEKFYRINSGKILFDKFDIDEIDANTLRSAMIYVSQDPYIFAANVYENISYGNFNATLKEIELAAEQANCIEFISKMSQGFYTDLGDKGIKLSRGQKQRIAIARAILNNPKILLLDEATSSLDAENETLVQNAISNLMKDRTTIIIAHKLATIKNADKIIVLNNGCIDEQGTHESLMSAKGIYRKLAKIQFTDNA